MIRFGSRGSDLALCQSRMVAAALTAATGEEVQIEVIETRGDRILDKPLPQIGGKGLFTEELEHALRDRRIDAAVHSMKDLPVCDPKGLTIGAVPERVAPHDVLICSPDAIVGSTDEVPLRAGSRVGTSSHRRRSALERLRPDLQFADIRGNVPTRVDKVRRGEYDEFNDEDLRREFAKHGNVTRAEMTIDKENGWSKGFGFVSFATVEEADVAIAALNGQHVAGREMKVEKTHDRD